MNTSRPKNQSLSLNANTFSVLEKQSIPQAAPVKTLEPTPQAAVPTSAAVVETQSTPSEKSLSITDLVLNPSTKTSTTTRPAIYGWQGVLNRLSFGALKLGPSKDEIMRRRGIETIQASLLRPMTILVANAAGGAGKTITSIGLAGTFGIHRGGEVAVWDNNETQGSLALRTNSQGSTRTVMDLLKAVDDPEKVSLGELALLTSAGFITL